MDINEKDSLEIFTDENKIILQKYQPSCIFCNNADDIVFFNGKRVCEECLKKIKGTIPAHSAMVLWFVREGNKLTVADFNKHFATSLTEGKDIVIITGKHLPHTNSVQLELVNGGKVIARAWFNYGKELNAVVNRSIIYKYSTDYTFTAKVLDDRISPTPGTIPAGNMPATTNK